MLTMLSLLLSVSAFAFQATEPQLVRVLDGRHVPCKERHEVGKVTFTPAVGSLSLDERFLSATLDVSITSCTLKGESEFSLQPRLPLAPKEYLDLDGRPIRVEYRDADLFVGDADYRMVALATVQNSASQRVAFKVDLERALSASQRRDFLDGKPVRARLALMVRRIATLVRGTERSPLGQESLGSFTFFVTLAR